MSEVLLLRDMPEEDRPSMERFADALERGFAGDTRFHVTGTAVRPRWPRLGPLDSYLARFVRYPLQARRRPADLYHVADHGYAHLAALLPSERTIVSCHDLILLRPDVAGFRGRPTSVWRFRWTTSYLAKVARVVCGSESTRRDAIRLRGVPEERTVVVHYGVDGRFRPLGRERRSAILHVSTGVPYKNERGVVEVAGAVRRGGHDVGLERVGPPLAPPDRARAVELGLRVVEHGRVSDERLVELYNEAAVLLFPSFYEGFGWPALESMACGTPVVVSDAPSLQEVVGDAGLTAPARDVDALAAAVSSILGSPERAGELRARGLERAAGFTWERTVEGYRQVYAGVLAEAA